MKHGLFRVYLFRYAVLCYNPVLFVSVYILKAANETCSTDDIIDNEDECKSAATYLNDAPLSFNRISFNLTFMENISLAGVPYGCFAYSVEDASFPEVYWNTNSSGSAEPDSSPICKNGNLFQFFTTNVKYLYLSKALKEHILIIINITANSNMTSTDIDFVPTTPLAEAVNGTDTEDSTTTMSEIPELATVTTFDANVTSMREGDKTMETIDQAMNVTDAEDSEMTASSTFV